MKKEKTILEAIEKAELGDISPLEKRSCKRAETVRPDSRSSKEELKSLMVVLPRNQS